MFGDILNLFLFYSDSLSLSWFISFLFGFLKMFLIDAVLCRFIVSIDLFPIWILWKFSTDFFSIWLLGRPWGTLCQLDSSFDRKRNTFVFGFLSNCSHFISFLIAFQEPKYKNKKSRCTYPIFIEHICHQRKKFF